MPRRIGYIVVILCLSMALTGCWWNRNRRDPNFGYSVRQAIQAQTIHPSQGSTQPVAGLDGLAAEKAIAGYRAGFGSDKDDAAKEEKLFIGTTSSKKK